MAFKNKGARNEKDAEMLDVIFDTLTLDFNFAENFGGSLDALEESHLRQIRIRLRMGRNQRQNERSDQNLQRQLEEQLKAGGEETL